jgi:hypothetical protein
VLSRLWQNYSLSIVLGAFFLLSWFAQTIGGWYEFVAEQQSHGDTATAFGPDGYVWGWMQATFENWQSEFLQLFTFVVLTTFLVHRHSHESKDSDDEMLAKLDRIERALKELQKGSPA